MVHIPLKNLGEFPMKPISEERFTTGATATANRLCPPDFSIHQAAMSKILRILSVSVLLTAFGGVYFALDYRGKDMIVLKNGSYLLVDDVWRPAEDLSGADLYYERNRRIHFIGGEDIQRIEVPGLKHVVGDLRLRFRESWERLAAGGDPLAVLRIFPDQIRFSSTEIAVMTVALLLVLLLFSRRLQRGSPLKPAEQPLVPPPKAPAASCSQKDVVRFFLNIYRQQLSAEAASPMEYVRLSGPSPTGSQVFELRVKLEDEWVTRRMTIGPLGEDSGSKSKCYYVIYDVHLVVKIPPRRVPDFASYIKSIQKEGHIVDKLAPSECIIPNVSVIMALIHKLPFSAELSPDLLEEKYIQWLHKHPELQENLKIQGAFVYFMDLSRYYFLGQILDELHDLEDAIPSEIAENLELIWDPGKFKGRYGKRRENVCYEIRDLYYRSEGKLRQLVADSGASDVCSPFQLQKLFMNHLAWGSVDARETKLSPDLLKRLDLKLAALFRQHQSAVQVYRETLREYVLKIRLAQNTPIMAGIIINLLDLLSWLRKKQVAMRDLKPDNLLVAGDPGRYPSFLRSAGDYTLGIIDVETAVDFGHPRGDKIKQPLLGGTPFFATPAHFFKNEGLRRSYHNIRKVLHLQDWHAVVAMIYRVVTGDNLFEQTAGLFAEIKNQILGAGARGIPETDLIKRVNRMFWHSAATEFQVKTGKNESALRSVEVTVPKNAAKMFYKILLKENRVLQEIVRTAVQTQQWFVKPGIRRLLREAPAVKMVQLMVEFEKKNTSSRSNTVHQSRWLKSLLQAKQRIERKAQLAERLSQPVPELSAYELMVMMFNTVSTAMYPETWNMSHENREVSGAGTFEDGNSLAATA
jgi:hypothetical protein